ncbi:MAG: hypothetical protein ACI8Z1_002455 [Candidatus Azotimanducaceae bacterium]|jgi:hypothetical protein
MCRVIKNRLRFVAHLATLRGLCTAREYPKCQVTLELVWFGTDASYRCLLCTTRWLTAAMFPVAWVNHYSPVQKSIHSFCMITSLVGL